MHWDDFTIKEIKEEFLQKSLRDIDDKLLESLKEDKRIGVQKLAVKYESLLNDEKARISRWEKMNEYSSSLHQQGYKLIAGIDEAGRGPLAGPVVAAAVILDPDKPIYGLDDSKKLTEKKRVELYSIIYENAQAVGVGIVDNNIIDKINILQATFQAMSKAVEDLSITADYILVDGNQEIPEMKIKQKTVIDGDGIVNSIAAASIIAKVSRDRIIEEYHQTYPEYGFDRNKGYGTSEHIEALKLYGTTPIHRYSFSIVNKYYFIDFKNKIKSAQSKKELEKLGTMIAGFSLFSKESLNILRKLYQERYRAING